MSSKKDRVFTSFPGLEYLTRVTTTWNEFLIGQAAETQKLWDSAKAGNFEVKDVAAAVAKGTEGYYEALVEACRTGFDANRTPWLHFNYKRGSAGTLEHPVTLSRPQPDNTKADHSAFASMAPGGPAFQQAGPGGAVLRQGDVPLPCYKALSVAGRKLKVCLDPDAFRQTPAGAYISLITAKNRAADAPLCIVVITVED